MKSFFEQNLSSFFFLFVLFSFILTLTCLNAFFNFIFSVVQDSCSITYPYRKNFLFLFKILTQQSFPQFLFLVLFKTPTLSYILVKKNFSTLFLILQKMENTFITNVHELAYAGFFAQECPAAELRIISKFFKASMVVYKAGNVSYNAVMMANTIITDFFVKYHKLFARGISLEFVDSILTILFCYDGFWDILNRINVHLFYLTYRHQILTILSNRMATMYGAQIFKQIFDRLPFFNLGENNLGAEERGIFTLLF